MGWEETALTAADASKRVNFDQEALIGIDVCVISA